MIPYTPISHPSYVEGTAAEGLLGPPIRTETEHQEHQVLEAQLRILKEQLPTATEWTNRVRQSEMLLIDDQETIIFANPYPWVTWLADDLSPQISKVAMQETIIKALRSRASQAPVWSIDELSSQISNAEMPEAIITVLRRGGLDAVADRLSYLHRLVEDDQDEPSINLDSLRKLALFLLTEQQLGNPQIGVNPDGLTQAEWPVGEKGVLAMEFLPSGFIRFVAISAPAQRGVECKRVSGTLSKSETLNAIRPFTDRLASP